jgi:hypothetical protein
MSSNDPSVKETKPRGVQRIPEQSFLYDKVVPAALIVMAVLMVIILLIAAAIVLGLIHL